MAGTCSLDRPDLTRGIFGDRCATLTAFRALSPSTVPPAFR
ncbi:hypothetical protein I553_4377 [Mycobacterium xenopi 4042]|uniref:Uncharacterized protein n=1 Tax=Mycobacterium xenopi 4042 TaxID=1299334 RepID=X8AG03_MYCXE|nr:hypothetical protein I553_4377 [Mycobacterium xenopi 4042]